MSFIGLHHFTLLNTYMLGVIITIVIDSCYNVMRSMLKEIEFVIVRKNLLIDVSNN